MILSSLVTATFLYLTATPQQADAYSSLVNRLKGKILLRVQHRGEAWYVNSDNGQRYFLGSPTAAYNLMKSLGLGITDADLSQIPLAPGYFDENMSALSNTYSNTSNGLTLNYPVNWQIQQYTDKIYIVEPNHQPSVPYFSIEWKNQTIEEYVNEYNASMPEGVDGISETGFLLIGVNDIYGHSYNGTNAMGGVYLNLFEHDGMVYIINRAGYTNIGNPYGSIIDSIIDTIDFN